VPERAPRIWSNSRIGATSRVRNRTIRPGSEQSTGIAAHAVEQRTHEVGLARGARRSNQHVIRLNRLSVRSLDS
jgi:hypothetical protein